MGSITGGVGNPSKVRIAGKSYRVAVFQVIERDMTGRPTTCRCLGEKESVAIDRGDEFIVGYVPDGVLNRLN